MAEIKDPENTIIMETTTGKVVIQLLPEVAPSHVARIKELVSEGAYDGVVFHRVIEDFMAQTGDVKFGKKGSESFNPARAGMGGSDKPDLKAEFSAISHVRGTCSMARSQSPNSANSQFFICFTDLALAEQAVHRLGPGHRRHGSHRQGQARRACEGSRSDRFHQACFCGLRGQCIRPLRRRLRSGLNIEKVSNLSAVISLHPPHAMQGGF